MSNENKQRVALYLDKELVRNADIIKTKYGYKSRNDLYSKAIEAFIANEIIESNDNCLVYWVFSCNRINTFFRFSSI